MDELLRKYIGQNIGINFKEPKKYDFAKLIKVESNYFTILDTSTNLMYSYSFSWILNIIESGKIVIDKDLNLSW